MKSIVVKLLTVAILCCIVAPFVGEVEAQRSHRDASIPSSSSSGLVSGSYRILVHQTAIVTAPASVGVDGNSQVVASLADITNLGAAAPFDPTVVSIATYGKSPLEIVDGTPADVDSTTDATIHANLSLDGNFTITENSTIRLMLVFPLANVEDDASLGIRVGDQVASLENTIVQEFAPEDAPTLETTMRLRIADVTGAPGSGQLSVIFRDGGAEDIFIAAIDTPEAGTAAIPGCFFNESSAAISAMAGGTVWLEEHDDGYLVWINNPSMGIFDLLQGRVAQEGFGGANGARTSAYSSWLSASTDWAKSQGLGLWTDCTTAAGEWKVQPTAAPEPTKSPEDIRAQYQWVDSRDLVIRPGTFEGQKIAIAGTVFNISVEGNFTGMQIWLDGGSEAAVVGYFGDTVGIYEGTWITVYGEGAGTFEGTNAFGGTISQPMVMADIVDW